jgi:zinc protease
MSWWPQRNSRAKSFLLGTRAIRHQWGGSVLTEMVNAWMFGSLEELAAYESRIGAVTACSLKAVATRYLNPDLRVEAIIRGVETEPSPVTHISAEPHDAVGL